ncbi:MAG TPA: ATP-binding protein, partial [Rubrobacteraceae bacterium]|nr:ATP-binding protein [Rubrobacteraceae bacterium]
MGPDQNNLSNVARATEEHFQLLVEGTKDYAIFMLDPEGRISSWNAGAERIKGYRSEEVLGRYISCLYTEEDVERGHPAEELRLAQEQGRYEEEGWRVRKGGSRFWASVLITALWDEEGSLRGFSKVVRDVTERKQVEEEIRQLNETLEKRIQERTAELEEGRNAAESSSCIKSGFLANMSHELRTPMNGVIGMTGLLLDTNLDSEQRDYAETVRYSADNLLTIINGILDFSKIEAGRLDLEIIDFDLRNTVEETSTLFVERVHEKDLELTYLVNYDVPGALRGDPRRLTQILTNLLGNAIKFTEEGEVVLRVEPVEETDESATIRFSVTDPGIGLPEAQQGHLFQSFTQADGTATRRYGGTGLGLAISKQLVELMGGEIGVESEPGVGSTFWFTIPLEKQPEEAARKPRTDLQSLRVLVVDDNATSREIIQQLVLSWGM